MNNVTVREFIGNLRSQFSRIDAAVFTSFTFDGGFFENNVLPLIFDIEEKNEKWRRLKVNEALVSTDCCVFFDGNNRSSISGKYQYQVAPIQLRDRFFHPKNVILAGLNANGENMVVVSAGSANLTLSGWGKQEEVISDIYLESSRMEKQVGVLRKFLLFVQEHAQKRSAAVTKVLKCLEDLPDKPRTETDHTTDLYFGGIKGAPPFARILLDERDGQRWDELRVISPFWHDMTRQMERFPCHSYVLIPAKSFPSPDDNKQRYGLTIAQVEELKSVYGEDAIQVMDFPIARNSTWLFRHAKAYFAIKRSTKRLRAGIGSCNFTNAALSGERGNVESMIVTDLDVKFLNERIEDLKPVRLERTDEFEKEEMDDSPQRLPFIVAVDFDWKIRKYSYSFELLRESEVGDIQLHLPGTEYPICIVDQTIRGEAVPAHSFKDIRNYRITYRWMGQTCEHIGPVFEFNMDTTEKEYTPIPKSEEILQSWSSSDESGWRGPSPVDPDDESGVGGGEEDGGTHEPTDEDILSFYDIYRAFYDLRAKLKKAAAEKDTTKILLYLERRSDSVKRLSTSLGTYKNIIRIYIILKEIHLLAEDYSRYLSEDSNWTNTVKDELELLRGRLEEMVSHELSAHNYPENANSSRVIEWFETQFKQ